MTKYIYIYIILIVVLLNNKLYATDSIKELQGTWVVTQERTLNLGMLKQADIEKITSSELIINNMSYHFQEKFTVTHLLDSIQLTLDSGRIELPGRKYKNPFKAVYQLDIQGDLAFVIGIHFIDIDSLSENTDLEITVFQLEKKFLTLYLVRGKLFTTIGDHWFIYEKQNKGINNE